MEKVKERLTRRYSLIVARRDTYKNNSEFL